MNAILDKECNTHLYRALIGNKADLDQQRQMASVDGLNFALENGMDRYYEVSAL